jgi:tetratricopeptide (TPR) repeat protein
MSASHERAWAALSRERYDLAEREFRVVLTENPDDAQSHAGLALCLCNQEKFDEAEREAKLAIGLSPDFDFCHYVHGIILRDRNRFTEAATAAEEAIRLDPEDANNRSLLASIRGHQNRWADCLDSADAGLAIDAEHQGCTNLRALALTQLGRKDEASATIADALQRSPENSMTHANQGWALLHRNDPQKALEHFREALRLDPTNDWAREGLLTALKASNTFYRGILAFFLFMHRRGNAARWMIIIGLLVGQQVLFRISDGDSPLAWGALVVAVLATVFIALTWLANPLMNLMMRFHPHGRHALTPDQRHQSSLIAFCLLAAIGFFVAEINLGYNYVTSVMVLVLCVPLMLIHNSEKGWPRRVAILVACSFLFVAAHFATARFLIETLVPYIGLDSAKTMVRIAVGTIEYYFYGILIWSLASNFLMNFLPKR